jgi:hypothetical protein
MPCSASAFEIKNVHPRYGISGAVRTEMKVHPGDSLFITYDLEGLKIDPKTRKAVYETALDVFSVATKEKIFSKEDPIETVPQFGGDQLPGDVKLNIGLNVPAGKYFARITVRDRNGMDVKESRVDFELLPKAFAIVGLDAPSIGITNVRYKVSFALIDPAVGTDKKTKVSLTCKILDDAGKGVALPMSNDVSELLTKQMNEEGKIALLSLSLLPNRPGRFIIELTAQDAIGNQSAGIRYDLHVLDPNARTR